ncbi:hypothetical protein BU16DRAFT_62403 [Lophium mytilinum]|uniref:Uncharacterized protein n=1 Tax=Lophium mytilinum TaxID=390894 RepID=A0A6A6QP83_9PEZI|nr:hypothetical protein BU16DRAFT_62403 [Lophium mytilinum]
MCPDKVHTAVIALSFNRVLSTPTACPACSACPASCALLQRPSWPPATWLRAGHDRLALLDGRGPDTGAGPLADKMQGAGLIYPAWYRSEKHVSDGNKGLPDSEDRSRTLRFTHVRGALSGPAPPVSSKPFTPEPCRTTPWPGRPPLCRGALNAVVGAGPWNRRRPIRLGAR